VVSRCCLLDDERRERFLLVNLELCPERVDAGGLQPLLGPRPEVATRRLLQRRQQVGELGVAVRVVGEVRAQPGEELILADPSNELSQRRGTLGVRDPVEVDLNRL